MIYTLALLSLWPFKSAPVQCGVNAACVDMVQRIASVGCARPVKAVYRGGKKQKVQIVNAQNSTGDYTVHVALEKSGGDVEKVVFRYK